MLVAIYVIHALFVSNVLFLVYEVLINKVTLLYVYKLEKRIKKLFK